jgi:putative membrane protein
MSASQQTPKTSADGLSPTVVKEPSPLRTRTSATWFGICAAALTLVVLIIFMLQNTASVQVNFLWMHGSVPLALALLIAGVGVAIVAMVVGTARITQLRRLSRRSSAGRKETT